MRRRGAARAAAVAAVLLAAAGGFALGDAHGSGGAAPGRGAAAGGAPAARGGQTVPAADSPDAGFARDMAVHHQQAVELSYVVRDRTRDEEVRRPAYDIAQTQANQRGMLLGWLDLWGLPKVSADPPMAWMGMGAAEPGRDGALMPGMATTAQLDRLRTASGRQAEILYLRLMTAHHRGGVHMAGACAAACATPAAKRLAQGIVTAQQSEIGAMAELLRERGAEPPA
ncbi:DUF305 domain-containing protein [Streptomyces sulfonofaciens]|uniref:DUF305 domain-containing protein n=1 Tax=Streptomyces sulfonofaciens TaxID=68272 RepID=A0A919FYD0_9ACTN|nr:DUF305 domain-containing protein [Streptomyces sulfonofaciens]GHH74631.1 DUF305 domain-containing protein [Streptomyces sulfonofaciens]